MNLCEIKDELLNSFGGELEIALSTAHAPLSELVGKLRGVECTAEALKAELRPITVVEAHAIAWSVLHKGMAYHFEYMPAEQAMHLAWRFINAFGERATFFSTTIAPTDPRRVISSWNFIATSHTFEALLYCRGEHSSAIFLAVDED